nr:hypothetical protein BaRGS_022776 [Batillaria attramentaria]
MSGLTGLNKSEDALQCLQMAKEFLSKFPKQEYLNPAGLYLKLRIMLMAKENASAIRCVLDELLQHPDTVVDLCHSVILLLQKYSM